MARYIYIEVRDIRGEGEDSSVLSFDHVEVVGVVTVEGAYEEGPKALSLLRETGPLPTDVTYGAFVNDYVVELEAQDEEPR